MQSDNKLKVVKITKLPHALLTFLYLVTSHRCNTTRRGMGIIYSVMDRRRKSLTFVSIGI
jgi:hypothetical protein